MSTKNYNPADKIKEFKDKTAERGYGYFSAKAVDLARSKNMNAKADQSVCQSMAEDAVASLMASVNNFQASDHTEAREKYYNKYGGDSKKAFDMIYQKLCKDNGIGNLPMRDT